MAKSTINNELKREAGELARRNGQTGTGGGQPAAPTPTPVIKVIKIYLGGIDPRQVLADWRRWGRPVIDLGGGRLNNDLRAYLGGLSHENLIHEWAHVVRLGDWYASELKKRGNRDTRSPKLNSYTPAGFGKAGDPKAQTQDKEHAQHLLSIASGG